MQYTPEKRAVPTGLDEIGIHLGLTRIDGENLADYQRRLLLEARQPSGPTEIEFVRSLGRRVGEFDIPVFRIDLDLDANDEPLAADPFVEITSSYLRAYSDYANEVVDVEINLTNNTNGAFLTDVVAAFAASTYFSVTTLDPDYTYRPSKNLRYGNTDVHVIGELLAADTKNKLVYEYVKNIYPRATVVFRNEVADVASIVESGDFYCDYTNGVVYSYEVQGGIVSYTYRDFPYTVFWQPVRVYPYRDEDKKYFQYDTLISDSTGLEEYTLLNSDGASVANTVIAVHPLTWGI